MRALLDGLLFVGATAHLAFDALISELRTLLLGRTVVDIIVVCHLGLATVETARHVHILVSHALL